MKIKDLSGELCEMLFLIIMNKAKKNNERLTMKEINHRMEKFAKKNTESAIRFEYGRVAK